MIQRTCLLLAILPLALLASCAAPSETTPSPSPPPPAQKAQPKTPAASLDNHTSHKFDPGVEIEEWKLHISRAQQITARYLIFHDGNQQIQDEINCTWTVWHDVTPQAVGHLYLVTENGEAFGVKNQRFPSLHLEFEGRPPQSVSRNHAPKPLTLAAPSFSSQIDSAEQISANPKEPTILYKALYNAPGGDQSLSISSNVNQLINDSKGGRTIVAVTLDWTPLPATQK